MRIRLRPADTMILYTTTNIIEDALRSALYLSGLSNEAKDNIVIRFFRVFPKHSMVTSFTYAINPHYDLLSDRTDLWEEFTLRIRERELGL